MFIEKRRFHRADVHCKIFLFFGENHLLLFYSHTENISAGGVMVIIEKEIAYSTVVDLELFLLDRGKPIKCKGKIAWAHEIKPTEIKPSLFNTGIQFIDISDSDREEIKKFLLTILPKGHSDKD